MVLKNFIEREISGGIPVFRSMILKSFFDTDSSFQDTDLRSIIRHFGCGILQILKMTMELPEATFGFAAK